MTKSGKLNGIEIKFERIPTEKILYQNVGSLGWFDKGLRLAVGKEYSRFTFDIKQGNYSHFWKKHYFVLETRTMKVFMTGCMSSFDSNNRCSVIVKSMLIECNKSSNYNLIDFL